MILDKKITHDRLKRNGWNYMDVCPFTNKPKWWKGTHKLAHIDLYSETFTYNFDTSSVTFHGGEFSTIRRNVSTMRDLKLFYKVLKPKQRR